MELWIIWLIVIGVLLIVEVLTQMMWALCLAIGFLCAVFADLSGVSLLWQIVIAGVGSVFAYLLLVPVFQKWHALSVDKKGRKARTGMDALLGRKAIVTESVTAGKPGRARIDGDNWQVVSNDRNTTIPKGTEVIVTGYDSIILEVRPTSPSQIL